MSEANDRQVGGDHYAGEYQHWDFVKDVGMPYMEAQVTRYISRWRKKDGVEALEKALHFLAKMKEQRTWRIMKLHQYATLNSVSDREGVVLRAMMVGNYDTAHAHLSEILADINASPTGDYVNQDPDLKATTESGAYSWTCHRCGDKYTFPNVDGWSKVIKEHRTQCNGNKIKQ